MPQQPAKPAMTYSDLVAEWRSLATTYATSYAATRRSLYSRLDAAYTYCADELERAIQATEALAGLGEDGDELARYFVEFVEP